MTRTAIITGVVILAAAAIAVGAGVRNEASQESQKDRTKTTRADGAGNDPAPSFALPDYDGEMHRLENIDAPAVVVNLWASWCPFCTDELPDLARLQDEYPERVQVVAINRAESVEKAKGFTDSIGVSDRLTFLMDREDTYYQTIGGIGMPETLFLGPERTIRIHKRGPMEFPEMKEKVEALLP